VGWAIDRTLVDPGEGIDVKGPAQLRIEGGGAGVDAGVLLVVTRGQAHVRTKGEHALAGAFATLRGQDADWTLEQRADRMRVVVRLGDVLLSRSGEAPLRLASGAAVDVLADGRVVDVGETTQSSAVAARAPSAVAPAPGADRPALAGATPDGAPPLSDVHARERASFLDGELELKAGRVEAARERLETLMRSSDPALAGDAAFLLARSSAGAAERAGVLARYLQSNPPQPYRAQATAERATALCESGRVAEARALLDGTGDAEPPEVTRQALAGARECLRDAR
jgi:hypothetical protein